MVNTLNNYDWLVKKHQIYLLFLVEWIMCDRSDDWREPCALRRSLFQRHDNFRLLSQTKESANCILWNCRVPRINVIPKCCIENILKLLQHSTDPLSFEKQYSLSFFKNIVYNQCFFLRQLAISLIIARFYYSHKYLSWTQVDTNFSVYPYN